MNDFKAIPINNGEVVDMPKLLPAKIEGINLNDVGMIIINPDGTQVPRGPFGQFLPGISGNPAGPPKGYKQFTTKVRAALEKIYKGTEETAEVALVNKVLDKAIIEGDSHMIKLIWNYLDGMPQLHIDHTSEGEKIGAPPADINLDELTDEIERKIRERKTQ